MAALELIELSAVNFDLMNTRYRAEDEAECALAGNTAIEAAHASASAADTSYAVYCGGELCGFAGYKYTSLLGPCDLWLLTTDAVERHKLTFTRFARAAVAYLHQCHQLRIVVAIRYGRAQRLAESLGFRFGEPVNGFVMGVTD